MSSRPHSPHPDDSTDATHLRPSLVNSHNHSNTSGHFFTNSAVDAIVGDGGISTETADILGHLLPGDDDQPHVDDTTDDLYSEVDTRPWYKKANPWFVMPLILLSAFVYTLPLGARAELYVKLTCAQLRPDYYYSNPPLPPAPGPVLNASAVYFTTVPGIHPSIGNFDDQRISWPSIPFDPPEDRPRLHLKRPLRNEKCTKDPVVQAAVAKLVMVMTMVVGVLTCATAGWWGQLSDRYGRKVVLICSASGVIFSGANLIFVAHFYDRIPGGYWFLVLTSITDGLLGGITTASSALHAYVADVSEHHERSKIFSAYMGSLFVSMAFGPSVGSLLISRSQNLLMPFYASIACHAVITLLIVSLLPESLSKSAMQETRRKWRVTYRETLERIRKAKEDGSWGIRHRIEQYMSIFAPLKLLLPQRREGVHGTDWNLSLIALAIGSATTVLAILEYKRQYVIVVFGWNAEQIGYFTSIAGAARAIFLILILPLIIRIFKPKPARIALPISPDEPLQTTGGPGEEHHTIEGRHASSPLPPILQIPPHKVAKFDLQVARVSIVIEVLSYLYMALHPDPKGFIVATVFGSFGAGFSATGQSLALYFAARSGYENGKLFGALGMLQALNSQIVGPLLYGTLYVGTVTVFPQAIFIATVIVLSVTLIAILLIRVQEQYTDPTSSV